MKAESDPWWMRAFALAGVVGISFSAIFVRLSGASPSTAAIFRTAYALPLLVIGWMVIRRRDLRSGFSRWMAFLAGVFLAIDLALWHRAIVYIGAGLATVLASTQVVFVGLIAWLVHRERPSTLALATIPVVFGGITLISGLGRRDAYGSNPLLGVVYGILAGLAYTVFLVIFRYSNRRLVPAVAPLLDATAGALAGSIPLAWFDRHLDLAFHWPMHGWLLALAIVAQVCGWLLITVALPRLPALDTSVLLVLQPMLTVLWGLLIFSEFLSPLQWSGVSLVVAGVTLLSLRGTSVRTERAQPIEPALP
ncbi:MAG: DMT family transporter [Acidobacteriota bacterium]